MTLTSNFTDFVGNEQEHFRQSWEWGLPNAMSSNIDDRTLHEMYGWPFQDSVKAGVASVMCSYQMTNNSYTCGNSKLLNGILKDEWGFQGFVQSDWLAQRSGVASALAGLDSKQISTLCLSSDGLGRFECFSKFETWKLPNYNTLYEILTVLQCPCQEMVSSGLTGNPSGARNYLRLS